MVFSEVDEGVRIELIGVGCALALLLSFLALGDASCDLVQDKTVAVKVIVIMVAIINAVR